MGGIARYGVEYMHHVRCSEIQVPCHPSPRRFSKGLGPVCEPQSRSGASKNSSKLPDRTATVPESPAMTRRDPSASGSGRVIDSDWMHPPSICRILSLNRQSPIMARR